MQVYGASSSVPVGSGPYAIGLGIFDGVHRGHRALLGRVLELAARDNVQALAYTFHPHPSKLLAPASAPRLIEPIETRLDRFAALGFAAALVEPFTAELAAMSAEAFIADVLVGRLRARHVVVGEDFTFGTKRSGNVEMLRDAGKRFGFEVHPMGLVRYAGLPVTSTRIRHLIDEGDVLSAGHLLARPFSLTGVVLRGHQRGTAMGYPTANIEPHNELVPINGVYVARVSGAGLESAPAVVNIGTSPTFNVNRWRVEAHILDFPPRPLYAATITVDFIERLRDELRFNGTDELVAAIDRDVADARAVFAREDQRSAEESAH
jgi:riboflavin kinase/FMN adenylyltransferase